MKKTIFILLAALIYATNILCQTKDSYYQIASEAYDQRNYEKALNNINNALKTEDTNLDFLLLKGNSLEKLEKYQEAFDIYSEAIRLHPKESISYNQRGLLLQKIQETEFSIRDFTTALSFEKQDSIKMTLFINRGASKINIQNFQGAYDDFISAYYIDSLNIGVLNNLASVCDEVGKGNMTLHYLKKILLIDSTFIGAYVNIGFKYQEMSDYATAISYFDKAISIDPKDALAYSNKAYNEYKLGDLKKALADINKSIKIYPANSYAYRNRALIFIANKEISKACNDLDKALELGFSKMYGDEVNKMRTELCNKNSR